MTRPEDPCVDAELVKTTHQRRRRRDVTPRVSPMPLDEALVAELQATKAAIDELQEKLKDLVSRLREQGASAQEIAEALRT